MARRAVPLDAAAPGGALLARVPGWIAGGLVAALTLGALIAVIGQASPGGRIGSAADWAAIRFTLVQALLSAGFSTALAVPLARALARRRFRGRRLLIALFGAPFILPVIVAVLGLVTVFGRAGWVSTGLGLAGLPPLQIYGLHGVVLAHVFFNLPLATRLVLQGWQEIPAEQFRLAAQLDASPRDIGRLLERPMLRRTLPGAAAVIFAICLSSFAVALTLGGGPRATTIELAIYQAFRIEFDLGRAAWLACMQIALTFGAALLALRLGRGENLGTGLGRALDRWDGATLRHRLLDALLIALAALLLLLPLAAVVAAGVPGLWALPPVVRGAALNSVLVALASTLVMLLIALPMSAAAVAGRGRGVVELAALLGLAVSPLVIGTGLFIIINPLADPLLMALPLTGAVNAVMALPFAMRILLPRARQVAAQDGRLAQSLGLGQWWFTRRILLPRMRAQIGFAAGLSAALSMGDLGVIALFASPGQKTLPLVVYELMGSYRMEASAAAALLLLVLSMSLFWLFDRGGKFHAEA